MKEMPTDSASRTTEPVPIFETFVTGIAEISDRGDFVRIVCTVERPIVGTPDVEHAVVSRLIVPRSALANLLTTLTSIQLEPRVP